MKEVSVNLPEEGEEVHREELLINFRGDLLQLRIIEPDIEMENSTPTLTLGKLNLLEFKIFNVMTKLALTKDFVCWTHEKKVSYMNLNTKEIRTIDLE